MKNSRRPFLNLFVIAGLVVVLGWGMGKIKFTDNNLGLDNVLIASEQAEFDLLINGTDDPQSIVNIADLKPGDDHLIPKTVRVDTTDIPQAKIFVHLKDLNSSQGVQLEPEIVEETENGTQSNIDNYLTYDLSVADQAVIGFGDQVLLPDAVSCWIPLGTINTNTDVGVTQSFHFDAGVTNWAQGDSLTFTEDFLALSPDAPFPQAPQGSDRVWNEAAKSCIDAGMQFVDQYLLTFTCTSGCSGDFPHTLNILTLDGGGNFSGNGSYNPNTAYTWDVTGTLVGTSVNFQIVYTGLNPGYTVNGTGSLLFDGVMSGTATALGQAFTWIAEKI